MHCSQTGISGIDDVTKLQIIAFCLNICIYGFQCPKAIKEYSKLLMDHQHKNRVGGMGIHRIRLISDETEAEAEALLVLAELGNKISMSRTLLAR